MTSAIELEKVNFGYSKKTKVLHEVNLNVPQGSIFGFLGANGAGKTTTLRLVLGLLKPHSGSISIVGENIQHSFPTHFSKVGSLIESASLYGHLSAVENLNIWKNYFDIKQQNRVQEILEIVDLKEVGRKKTEHFSTGMKQRLGLAIALLQDPEILILDEPTNGLDPMGIIDLRHLLNKLKEQGKTILLSSHILPEVEKIVTHLGIIKEGSVVFEGSINQLKEMKDQNIVVKIKVDDILRALDIFKGRYAPHVDGDEITITVDHHSLLPNILKDLINKNVNVYQFSPESKDLENLFLSIARN